MFNTSTVTTSVAHNCTLGNESKFLNHMCVPVLARGDSTLFNATSKQEEDIVELCVDVGQTHCKGVLCLSVTELVFLFPSNNEMMAMACRVTKATARHEEPIKLYTSPLSTAHLRAYIAGRDGCPQSPTPDREEVPQSSPSNPHPYGRSHANSKWTYGTLRMPS